MLNLDIKTLVFMHLFMLATMTVAITALWWIARKRSLLYWALSDIVGLTSVYMFNPGNQGGGVLNQLIFPITAWLVVYLRVIAVATPEFVQAVQRYVFGGAFALIACNVVLRSPGTEKIILSANSFMFSVLSLLMILGLRRNKAWGLSFGGVLLTLATVSYFLVSVFRAVFVFYSGPNLSNEVRLIDTWGMTFVVAISIISHIGLILMIFNQLHQSQTHFAEQAAREAERRELAEKSQLESQRLSEEQKGLIEVLTHEVRQPLNNASAALQSITHELENEGAPHLIEAALRAQGVIEKVGTALSNALVAATILERQHKFYPARCEPVAIAEIVARDFPRRDQERLKLSSSEAPLFVTVDPILIRIALRNLFDNALRYSPAGSDILVEIRENETRMGVEFNVSNDEPDPEWIEGVDVFARRMRGKNPKASGSGMGLYIAAEIAKLHEGALTTRRENGRRVFSLFLGD